MKGALRLFYPATCPGCGDAVDHEGALCSACWAETRFVDGLACPRCGAPLPDDGTGGEAASGTLCDDCIATPRPWAHGRAALVYGGIGRSMVLALKHGDRPDLAPVLGGWLARAAAPLVRPGMVVVPVPIHLLRLAKRKYNQAALLSAQVARAHGLPHRPDLLVRRRNTPMQDHKGVSDRFANIEDALFVPERRHDFVQGRAFLLIDDVMTSGATLGAAAQLLRDAGAGSVSVAVLARAVKSD